MGAPRLKLSMNTSVTASKLGTWKSLPSVWMRQCPSDANHRFGQPDSSTWEHKDTQALPVQPKLHHLAPSTSAVSSLATFPLCPLLYSGQITCSSCISPTLPTMFPQVGRLFHRTNPKSQLSFFSVVRLSLTFPGRGTHWHSGSGLLSFPVISFL